MTHVLVISILLLIIAAFIPSIIASCKDRHFSKWYMYSLFLFPIALIHSLMLKKSTPVHTISVVKFNAKNPVAREKKVYRELPVKDQRRQISPTIICVVFFSKLIFGAFVALSLFALFRTFVSDIPFLRTACFNFMIVFSLMLSIVQFCRFSRFPIIADEITKRSLIILFYSVISSLPLFLLKEFVLDKLFFMHTDFFTFMCSAVAFGILVFLILRRQRVYYSIFPKFSDYCTLSIAAYTIYAAIALIILSADFMRPYVNAVAMPMQVLTLTNLGELKYVPDFSFMYSSALAHFFIALIILFSGLMCRNFKQKEILARVEYRSAAFRMNRKRILRRHIPNMDFAVTPLK